MKKIIGVLVGEHGNWTFFDEIFKSLAANYETRVFRERVYETPLLYGRLNRWALRGQIRSLLRRSDLCFFEWASELLEVATQMPKSCPIVTRLHAYELHAWAPRINWEQVDTIIVVSDAMARKLAAAYPECAPKIAVVYNGVSLRRFTPAPRPFAFDLGMLCTVEPRKRVYEVIMMLDALRRRHAAARLQIAGGWSKSPASEEYYAAVRGLVTKLGLEEHVSFAGHVTDTPAWLQQIDIFISNSYHEGQQVALLEAMASGCCCFSHVWDGAEEVLPPDHLFTTEAELLAKITAYAEQPEEIRRQRRARMRAIAKERFDIETTKAKILTIVDATIGPSRR